MSKFNSKMLLGAVIAIIVVAGLAYAAMSISPQLGKTTTGNTSLSSTTAGQPSSMGSSTQTASSSGVLGFGALDVYLTDAPPVSPQFSYLLINVSSVTLRYEGSIVCSSSITSSTATTTTSSSYPPTEYVYQVPSKVGTNVNLTNLVNKSVLLGATNVPAGNVSEIIFNITGAKAYFSDNTFAQLKVVANGKLMIPMHFEVSAGGSTDLTVDITPNSIHISNGKAQVLTPVVHVTAVQKGQGSSSTIASTTVSETITSSSVSSSTSSSSSSTSQTTSAATSSCSIHSETTTSTTTTSTSSRRPR